MPDHMSWDVKDVNSIDSEFESAYGGVKMGSDLVMTNTTMYMFGLDAPGIQIRGNRIKISDSYLYATIRIMGNHNSLYMVNTECETPWQGEQSFMDCDGTAIAQQHAFVNCMFWGGEIVFAGSTDLPIIHYPNGIRGLSMMNCYLDDGYIGIELGSPSNDVVMTNVSFHVEPGPYPPGGFSTVFMRATGIVRSIISNCLFNGQAGEPLGLELIGGSDITLAGNRFTNFDVAISADDVDRLVLDGGEFLNTPIVITDSDRVQIKNLTGYLDDAAVGDAFIELAGTIDEAWIHGCAVPADGGGGTAIDHGVKIGASVSNTEVRTNSNNWRGASIGALNDSGTGTVT